MTYRELHDKFQDEMNIIQSEDWYTKVINDMLSSETYRKVIADPYEEILKEILIKHLKNKIVDLE